MKKRVIALLCALVISSLAVMAVGAYIKYEVLKPYGLAQDKNIMELPFLFLTDTELRFDLEIAQNGGQFPDDTEPTTQPPETTVPSTTEPPHVHSFEPVEAEPTCEEEGYKGYQCACGEKDDTRWEIFPATGHEFACISKEPTCTEDGYVCYRCFCGTEDESRRETIPATGHDYQRKETKPTCTKEGCYRYICVCGAEDESRKETIPATGHDYKLTEVAPTCTEPGYNTYRCACGEKNSYYKETVPATGHAYKKTEVAPTCTKEGYTGYVCHCGADNGKRENIVPPTGHTYIRIDEMPTCTQDGKACYSCDCGEEGSYYEEVIPATGHTYLKVIVDPTCTEPGYTCYRCTCGVDDGRREEPTPASGHSYESRVVKPTCKDKGYTVHTCSICGHSYNDTWIDQGEHSYTSKVIAPTVEAQGYTEYTCSACGFSYKDNYTDKLPEPIVVPPVESDTYPGYDFTPGAVPDSWFDDALFIGDSRTDGLRLYHRSGKADYICGTSRTVFKYINEKDSCYSELVQQLSKKTYGKIFINLGINECWSSSTKIANGFKQLIEIIREYQPDAKIIIQGIMTVTEKYASKNSCFEPSNLNAHNAKLAELANGTDVFFIDVNVYFTDKEGYLYSDLTGDGCHLKAKHYASWAAWISYAVGQLGL